MSAVIITTVANEHARLEAAVQFEFEVSAEERMFVAPGRFVVKESVQELDALEEAFQVKVIVTQDFAAFIGKQFKVKTSSRRTLMIIKVE